MELCDLHAHSVFSDGTDTPERLVELAEAMGLSAIVLSDHNTVEGLPRFVAAAEGKQVEAVPGVEFSTDFEGVELHILGLWIQPEHYAAIRQLLQDGLRQKELSNIDLVEGLKKAGYDLDYGEIKASTLKGHVNRAHIAVSLTEKGYTTSVQDAFDRLLSVKNGFYHPPARPQAVDVIGLLRDLGAVSVLAHPFLNVQEPQLRRFLKLAVPAGLHGMEVLYGMYDEATTQLSKDLVAEFGILPSGGSDYHGRNKPHIQLGRGRGELAIPMAYCRKLKENTRKL